MTLRQKAIKILQIFGEPVEPNSWTEELIQKVIRVIDKRRKEGGCSCLTQNRRF